MACLLDIRLHSLSGLPRSGGLVELKLPNNETSPTACFAGEAFLGAWTRRTIPPGKDLQFEPELPGERGANRESSRANSGMSHRSLIAT